MRLRRGILLLACCVVVATSSVGCRGIWVDEPDASTRAPIEMNDDAKANVEDTVSTYVGGLGANDRLFVEPYVATSVVDLAELRSRALGPYADSNPRVVGVRLLAFEPSPAASSDPDKVLWRADITAAPDGGDGSPEFHVEVSGQINRKDRIIVEDAVLVK